MKIKIVTDSAANMKTLEGVDFGIAPLTIVTKEKEYIDDANLDVEQMVKDLQSYKGKSGTACPNISDWISAFGDADIVYCVTIISTLSGSYNSAMTAKQQYEEMNPDKKVFVLDSYTAGAEMRLLVEKIRDLVLMGKTYEEVCEEITEYKKKQSCLVFCLASLRNLANNGRISHAVAAISGVIGIRVIGDVNDAGQLNPTRKARGEKKAIAQILEEMKLHRYSGGRVIIDHCFNEGIALQLKESILKEFKNAVVDIGMTTGLCSFYAEQDGLMIGFER